ncbi:hypothetical protein F4818DRAFT_48670 [Hypoxylon cercidicola]|nr:hypothetical protein F4818DRAFT_48670 [Hypoxylon cercidicola]
MKPSLEALPVELVAHIGTLLDLQDIASLRLTNRNIGSKLHLAKFFAQKNVDLALTPLEDMARMTRQDRLGRLLQHCTITGVAEGDGSNTPIDNQVRLLTEAFSNLKQHSPRGRLASLCLRVSIRGQYFDDHTPVPDTFRLRKEIWAAALQTFNVTMIALHESQLPVDEYLDIFGGILGCSLMCDAFFSLTRLFTSVPVFRSLKTLKVNLSSPYMDLEEEYMDLEEGYMDTEERYMDPEERTPDAAADIPERSSQSVHVTPILQGLLEMSSIMPKLETLNIHWYNLGNDSSTAQTNHTSHVENNSSRSHFGDLNRCCLRGVYVSESDLLEFVKAVHPADLTMTDIHLVSGTYASIFEYLSSSDSPVTHYHLDDIHERNCLVHFDGPGKSKFRYLGVTMGPSTLARHSDGVKRPIHYRITSTRALGSGERMRWWKCKVLEFGPPNGRIAFL